MKTLGAVTEGGVAAMRMESSQGRYSVRLRRLAELHLQGVPQKVQWDLHARLIEISERAATEVEKPLAALPALKWFDVAGYRVLYSIDAEEQVVVAWDVIPT